MTDSFFLISSTLGALYVQFIVLELRKHCYGKNISYFVFSLLFTLSLRTITIVQHIFIAETFAQQLFSL